MAITVYANEDILSFYSSHLPLSFSFLLTGSATVKVSVMPRTGEFQVCENENILASGVVTSPQGSCLETDQYKQSKSVLEDKVSEIHNGGYTICVFCILR